MRQQFDFLRSDLIGVKHVKDCFWIQFFSYCPKISLQVMVRRKHKHIPISSRHCSILDISISIRILMLLIRQLSTF